MIGVPENAERISELAQELVACERVFSTRSELDGDSVARKEMVGRISAVRAANASTSANKMLGTAMERLSTGKRINSAKDDAAGPGFHAPWKRTLRAFRSDAELKAWFARHVGEEAMI